MIEKGRFSKKFLIMVFWIGLLLFVMDMMAKEDRWPVLKGPYLGQKPPEMTPQTFAPGIISTKAAEGCSSFSTDGKLYLFVRAGSACDGILIVEQNDGVWEKPILAPFSAGKYDWDFILAPDDQTLLVSSGRPLSPGDQPVKDYRIWITHRTEKGWSAATLLPPPVNTGQHDSYPSIARNGNLYFFSNRKGGIGLGDIYKAKRVGKGYPKVENLGPPINSAHHEVDPFIYPDESFIIFCSDKPGGFGRDDFYVTFRKQDGTFSKPINMGGNINSPFQEYIPYITPDGKYFFFTSNKSGNRDIYWVDAEVIHQMKPKNLNQ